MASKKSSRKSRKKTPTRSQRPVQPVDETLKATEQQPILQGKAVQESVTKVAQQEQVPTPLAVQAEVAPETIPVQSRRQQFLAVGLSVVIVAGLIIGIGTARNHDDPELQQASSSVLKADQVLQDSLTDGELSCGPNAIQQGPAPQSSTQQLQNVPVSDLQTPGTAIGASSNQASQSLQPAGCL